MTVGWGTLAYGLAAGAQLGLALVFLLNGARARRFDALMTSFAFYAFSMGLVAIVTARLHLSSSLSDYADWIRILGLGGLVSIVALVALIAVWTASIPRMVLVVFAVATAAIALLQLTLPNGLLVGEIDGLREVALLGDRFAVHEGSSSTWRPVLDMYLLFTFAVVVAAIVRGYRTGHRTHSMLMAATLAVTIGSSYYDSLVDFGIVATPYLAPFGTLAPAIAGAVFLAERSMRTERQLVEQTTSLEETVIERTAALIDANRRLEDQLARQRTSTRNLASLAERFELSNAMVAPNSTTIETSISALLETLGTMISASNVELRIDDDHVEGLLPRSTTWRRPTSEGARADADGDPTAIIEDIKVGTRSVGHLSADLTGNPVGAPDAAQYIGLAAEHLAGLIHRLDLVAQVADSAVEDERHRIAMELHDSVTQRMYSVSFLADAAIHEAGVASPELTALVERIRELVLSSLAELRVLLLELRPTSFDDVELHLLLEQLADNLMSAYDAEIIVDAASSPPMTTDIKTALYRISQEAISNACRHGHPDRIIVELAQDGDLVSLAIRDDGVGFGTTTAGNGAGLDNLRSRAGSIDAEIAITSSPGAGTSVVVRYARPAPPATSTGPSGSVGAVVTEGAPR